MTIHANSFCIALPLQEDFINFLLNFKLLINSDLSAALNETEDLRAKIILRSVRRNIENLSTDV